jgi:hypothetical protein
MTWQGRVNVVGQEATGAEAHRVVGLVKARVGVGEAVGSDPCGQGRHRDVGREKGRLARK